MAVTCQLSTQLQPQLAALDAPKLVVISRSVTGSPDSLRAGQLGPLLADLIAGAVGKGMLTLGGAPLSVAKQAAGTRGIVIRLSPSFTANGILEVSADGVKGDAGGFWSRLTQERQAIVLHAYAKARIDSELSAYLPKVPLVSAVQTRAPTPVSQVIGLACGDIDANDTLEAVVVGRREVAVGRFTAGIFQVETKRQWAELTPVSPTPLREPITFAGFEGNRLRIGTSDRAAGLELDWKLTASVRYPSQFPIGGGQCALLTGMGLAAGLTECDESAPEAAPSPIADAVASWLPPYTTRRMVATRQLGSDKVLVTDTHGPDTHVAGAGAQLALGDLDRDGIVELVVSRNVLEPEADGLIVYSLQDGRAILRFEVALPAISSISTCPATSFGPSPILVASANELLVLH